MAAYAALVSLLNNVHQIMNHPRLSTCLDIKQIHPLLENIDFLLDFVEGNDYGRGSKEVQDIERQIASAAHAVEDLIETHIVNQIYSGTTETSPTSLLDLQKSIQDMDAMMEKVIEVKEKWELKEEKFIHPGVAGPLTDDGETAMVGLDAELNQLLGELIGYQSSLRIISIVGMGGTGKTTLAKNIYENLLITDRFQFRAWATISEQKNIQELLLELLSSLGEFSGGRVDDLGSSLHKTLFGRRYLIVLDDIWNVKNWEEVKRFFPDNNNGSRVLLTTRLSNVAKDCGSSLIMVNFLNVENSWKLFCQKAFQNEECPPELREVGEKIVRLCNGLALTIVVIGGLLQKAPRNERSWRTLAFDLSLIPNLKDNQESLVVLSLSYDHLPAHLKPCFLYMGVFKEDSHILVSKIIKLWVAEGFIKPVGSQVLEEIAEGFVNDLIDRNLISVDWRRKNGKVRSCGLHDLLRDLCIKKAEEEQFFHVSKGRIRGTERRLIDDYWYAGRTGLRLPFIRSVITKVCIKQPIYYRSLRVLDEGGYKSEADYYLNMNLRYLAYNHRKYVNHIWELPTSVSLIWNLQTLIIKNFKFLIVAPIEFWKTRQLRHMMCSQIYLPGLPSSKRQDGLFMLNLQTLKTVVNLRLCEEVCKIIPNIKKMGLVYGRNFHGYDDSLFECLCNLDRLHKLESLYLSIKDWSQSVSNGELKKKLTISFPRSLKKLSLSDCELHWDDMKMIGSLPQLEVLKLQALSFSGEGTWSSVDGQFPRLKFLEINCDLVCWDADGSHFPVLENLYLNNLSSLEEIPLGISDIPTLEHFYVRLCSLSASVSAVRIKENRLENVGDDDLQFHVIVHKTDMDTFTQMLETEGLPIDNVQMTMYRNLLSEDEEVEEFFKILRTLRK